MDCGPVWCMGRSRRLIRPFGGTCMKWLTVTQLVVVAALDFFTSLGLDRPQFDNDSLREAYRTLGGKVSGTGEGQQPGLFI